MSSSVSRFSPAFATEVEAKKFLRDNFTSTDGSWDFRSYLRDRDPWMTPNELNRPLIRLAKRIIPESIFDEWFLCLIVPCHFLMKGWEKISPECFIEADAIRSRL